MSWGTRSRTGARGQGVPGRTCTLGSRAPQGSRVSSGQWRWLPAGRRQRAWAGQCFSGSWQVTLGEQLQLLPTGSCGSPVQQRQTQQDGQAQVLVGRGGPQVLWRPHPAHAALLCRALHTLTSCQACQGEWGRARANNPWVLSSVVTVWPESSLSLRGNDPFTIVTL